MKTKFTLRNFSTGKTISKIQITKPKMKGWTCVSSQRILPTTNRDGERLFYDANNRPYYAAESADGSHYLP